MFHSMSMFRVSLHPVPALARPGARFQPLVRRAVGGMRIIAILLAMASILVGCASLTQSWKSPEVVLVGLQPKELGPARQVFIANLLVRNPNDRTLPIKAMTYRLSLEGQQVAEGGGALDRQIAAFGEERVDVEVIGSLLGLAQQLPALMRKDRPLEWTASGTVALAGGFVTLPYRYSGKVDAQALMTGGR